MEIKQVTSSLLILISIGVMQTVSAHNSNTPNGMIDDRSSGDLSANSGIEWRIITDQVMGGVSSGDLKLEHYKNKDCLRMRGNVSTSNNGGFVQMSLPLSSDDTFDASAYSGIELEVAGNNELYNIHIRTSGLWLPWQSYRSSFKVSDDWQTVRIPFTSMEAWRTTKKFRQDQLKRIGLVAIGRDFNSDLCLSEIKFYSAD